MKLPDFLSRRKTRLSVENENQELLGILAALEHDMRPQLSSLALANHEVKALSQELKERRLELASQRIASALAGIKALVVTIDSLRPGLTTSTSKSFGMEALVRKAWGNLHHGGQDRVVLSVEESIRGISAICDPQRIELVFRNLLQNCCEAGSTRIIVAGARSKGNAQISIRIEDDGCGISAEAEGHLFSPGFSAWNHRPDNRGLGGLYVSRRIAELHGGELVHRSRAKARGSVFVLSFPPE